MTMSSTAIRMVVSLPHGFSAMYVFVTVNGRAIESNHVETAC